MKHNCLALIFVILGAFSAGCSAPEARIQAEDSPDVEGLQDVVEDVQDIGSPEDANSDVEDALNPQPRCDDELQNGDETGIDCGGSVCRACALEQSCVEDIDCLSGRCEQDRCAATEFITRWKTNNSGGTDGFSVHLPLVDDGNYNFEVDWGDGSETQTISSPTQPEVTHRYEESGTYTVTISGLLQGWSFALQDNPKNDAEKLVEIKNWGDLRLGAPDNYPETRDAGYFWKAKNMSVSATDTLILDQVESLKNMFSHCTALGSVPSMNRWDVSRVESFAGMFLKAENFNQDIGAWDVSGATQMHSMFSGADQFDQDIGAWDVSRIVNMRAMFQGAVSFNQDLRAWDVSAVTNMEMMFKGAEVFDQDLGGWNVSALRKAKEMLNGSGLSTPHYDVLLNGWSSQAVQSEVELGARGLYYSEAAEDARELLTEDPPKWDIEDEGLAEGQP